MTHWFYYDNDALEKIALAQSAEKQYNAPLWRNGSVM